MTNKNDEQVKSDKSEIYVFLMNYELILQTSISTIAWLHTKDGTLAVRKKLLSLGVARKTKGEILGSSQGFFHNSLFALGS